MSGRIEYVDRAIAADAARSDGLVSFRRLRAQGISRATLVRRTSSGLLIPVNSVVARLPGTALTPSRRAVAAALALGPHAFVSHRSAALIHGLGIEWGGTEVSIPSTRKAGRWPFIVHRVLPATAGQLAWRYGVRLSNPTRTIVELASCVDDLELAVALDRALLDRLTTLGRVEDAAAAMGCRGRAGMTVLRELITDRRDGRGLVRSWLESSFVHQLEQLGVPCPVRNHCVASGGRERFLDLAWPTDRVAVEAMGARWHASFRAQVGDVSRERWLTVDGWRILVATVADRRDPTDLLSALLALLGDSVRPRPTLRALPSREREGTASLPPVPSRGESAWPNSSMSW